MGADAEDVLQETYYRCIKYFPSYNKDSDFDKWFNKILYNVIKDFKADRGGLVVDIDPDYLEQCITPSEGDYGRLIDKLKKGLGDSHQEVIDLYYKYGYKPREIKQVVELSLTNITTIISRFKKELENDI